MTGVMGDDDTSRATAVAFFPLFEDIGFLWNIESFGSKWPFIKKKKYRYVCSVFENVFYS